MLNYSLWVPPKQVTNNPESLQVLRLFFNIPRNHMGKANINNSPILLLLFCYVQWYTLLSWKTFSPHTLYQWLHDLTHCDAFKMLTLCRWHFKCILLNETLIQQLKFDCDSFIRSGFRYVRNVLGNGWEPNTWLANIRISGYRVHWFMYASQSLKLSVQSSVSLLQYAVAIMYKRIPQSNIRKWNVNIGNSISYRCLQLEKTIVTICNIKLG